MAAGDQRRWGSSGRRGVAELTDRLNLTAWPEGSGDRGASGRTGAHHDLDEHGTAHLPTDQDGQDIAALELRHRGRARVEDSTRRQGHRHAHPPTTPEHNQAWLEISLIAQTSSVDEAD